VDTNIMNFFYPAGVPARLKSIGVLHGPVMRFSRALGKL
jgi:hypothetical protein